MRRNGKKEIPEHIALRRERVETLLDRGMSVRQIHAQLCTKMITETGKEPRLNPSYLQDPVGDTYSRATIGRDCQFIRRKWEKRENATRKRWRAKELAELNELKRYGYGTGDGRLVLNAIKVEAKLLGTAAPTRIDVHVNYELVSQLVKALERAGYDPETVIRQMIAEADAIGNQPNQPNQQDNGNTHNAAGGLLPTGTE